MTKTFNKGDLLFVLNYVILRQLQMKKIDFNATCWNLCKLCKISLDCFPMDNNHKYCLYHNTGIIFMTS